MESSSREGQRGPGGPATGRGGVRMPALLRYPSRHPIGQIQWWTAPPEASESRTLAASVEQKIYLKDTPAGAR